MSWHQVKHICNLSSLSLEAIMDSAKIMPSLTIFAKQDLGADEFLEGAVIAGFAIGRAIFAIPT